MAPDSLTAELDYPMVIVTTVSRSGERAGCLVGFHTQCSIKPLRWAVFVSIANRTYDVARDAEGLAVHFPSRGDHDMAELFGELTDDEVDKFTRCEWTVGPLGMPLLSRCPNRFVGRVLHVVDNGGDHVCFVLDRLEVDHPHAVDQLTFQSVRDLEAGHQP
ncbi:MAG TPA: flavin reductase [Acidimicrobiales bacterium]|jgi:flavin reductase (DIM6/NTAB) family NADH-FMN oxidoreductase RutF